MRPILFAVATIAVTSSAWAGDFFIVRDEHDKKCRIVETRPTEKTVVVIGDRAYVTREEAEKQLAVVCKDD